MLLATTVLISSSVGVEIPDSRSGAAAAEGRLGAAKQRLSFEKSQGWDMPSRPAAELQGTHKRKRVITIGQGEDPEPSAKRERGGLKNEIASREPVYTT